MKTNFNFINNFYTEVSEKNLVTLKIIRSFINKAERALHERNYQQEKLIFRYVNEAMTKFVYSEISEVDGFENIKINWDSFAESLNGDKPTYKLFQFVELMFDIGKINNRERQVMKEFNDKVNNEVHIINVNDLNDKIDGFWVEDDFQPKPIKYNEYVEMLEILFNVMKIVLRCLYSNMRIEQDEFDWEIYVAGMSSLQNLRNLRTFISNVDKTCVICNEGKLKIPDWTQFQNGPFLSCSNCPAKLSQNLNLKTQENEIHCPKCELNGNGGKMKRTASYIKNSEYYLKVFYHCNLCKEYGE